MHGWAYWWWNLDRASLFRPFLENMKHTVSIYRVYLPWDTYMLMIARVLLNWLNKLWKMIKCEFNKFNDTWARILDSFYHMTKTLLWNRICFDRTLHLQHCLRYIETVLAESPTRSARAHTHIHTRTRAHTLRRTVWLEHYWWYHCCSAG